jgi:hypothetical protein
LGDDGQFSIMSGANGIVKFGTVGTSSSGGLTVMAMPPHGQAVSIIPRSDTDGSSHITGSITFDYSPNAPAPIGAASLTPKSYVDGKLAGKLSVGTTAPSAPAVNDIWIDTT